MRDLPRPSSRSPVRAIAASAAAVACRRESSAGRIALRPVSAVEPTLDGTRDLGGLGCLALSGRVVSAVSLRPRPRSSPCCLGVASGLRAPRLASARLGRPVASGSASQLAPRRPRPGSASLVPSPRPRPRRRFSAESRTRRLLSSAALGMRWHRLELRAVASASASAAVWQLGVRGWRSAAARPGRRLALRRRLGRRTVRCGLGRRRVGGLDSLVRHPPPRPPRSAAICWRTCANAAASVLSMPPSGSWTAWLRS